MPIVSHKRRVLLMAPQPFYEDRGTPIALRHVLRALVELGHEVDVLTFPVGRSLELPGVRYFRAPNPLRFRSIPVGFSLRKVFLDLFLWWMLRDCLKRNRYLCVQAVEEAGFAAVAACRGRGVPVVYDMQSSLPEQLAPHPVFGTTPFQALGRRLESWLLRSADFVVCSAGLGDRIRAAAPGVAFREWRFPSELPPVSREQVAALRAELGVPDGAPVVVYSGTFEAYQGLPLLIEAVPRIAREVPEVVFVLVGAARTHELDAARRALPADLQPRVRLLPRQERSAVPRYLELADVLVSPRTQGANLPLKVFDYMAAGKPIVATDIPAHRAVLDTSRALLVEAGAEPLADGIAALLHDRARGRELAEAAREFVQGENAWGRFVESVREIFEDVAARAEARGD